MSVPRWLPPVGVALVAAAFAFLNRFERVAVDLGLFTIHRVPLAVFFFGAFLLGMGAMMLLTLRQDLRVRELLREHDTAAAPAPPPASQPAASGDEDRTLVAPAPRAASPMDDRTLLSGDDRTLLSGDDRTLLSGDDRTLLAADDRTVPAPEDRTVASPSLDGGAARPEPSRPDA